MPYAFGKLKERYLGALVHMIIDGTAIGTVEAPISSGPSAKPAPAKFTADYSLGRVNNAKPVQKTKERTREWAKPGGGYQERTLTTITEDAMEVTFIDYATAFFDQLNFGLMDVPADGVSQQPFEKADRYADAWVQVTFVEEDGTIMGVLTHHARVSIQTAPEIKSEDGSPVYKIAHLGDGGALDTYIPYPVEES